MGRRARRPPAAAALMALNQPTRVGAVRDVLARTTGTHIPIDGGNEQGQRIPCTDRARHLSWPERGHDAKVRLSRGVSEGSHAAGGQALGRGDRGGGRKHVRAVPGGGRCCKAASPGGGPRPYTGVGSNPYDLTPIGKFVYFSASKSNADADNGELYRTNGTAKGTRLVKHTGYTDAQNLTRVGNRLYFSGFDAGVGYELWRSDGTKAGTHVIKDINPGRAPSNPQLAHPARVDGLLHRGRPARRGALQDQRDGGRDQAGQGHRPGRRLLAR